MEYELSADWFSFSFPAGGRSNDELIRFLEVSIAKIMPSLCYEEQIFEGQICNNYNLQVIDLNKGFLGFKNSADLTFSQKEGKTVIGKVAWGGLSQKSKVHVSITSMGSKMLDPYKTTNFLRSIDAVITRVDIAFDDFDGINSVDSSVIAYKNNEFSNSNRSPSAKLIDDLGNKTGKTLYIGKRESGKMLRIYEKGLQLGDKRSFWVRFEVEIHNTDREIPLNVLEEKESIFLGSYDYLNKTFSHVMASYPQIIKCSRLKTKLNVITFLGHLSKQYGKFFKYVHKLGISPAVIFETLARDGKPKRFNQCHDVDIVYAIAHNYNFGA